MTLPGGNQSGTSIWRRRCARPRRVGSFRGCPLSSFSPTVSLPDAIAANAGVSRVFALLMESMSWTRTEVAGSIKEIKGAAKEAIGKAIGDAKLQSDGKADRAIGKIQNAVGGLNDAVSDAVKK